MFSTQYHILNTLSIVNHRADVDHPPFPRTLAAEDGVADGLLGLVKDAGDAVALRHDEIINEQLLRAADPDWFGEKSGSAN